MKEDKIIPYGKQSIDDSDIAAVVEALKQDLMTTGPSVAKFESALCELTGAKYAIACSNATTGLHLACAGFGINQKSYGVTSPLTFLASANCFEFCNAHTDFVDIDEKSLCLSPNALQQHIEKSTHSIDAIIPVHFAGYPADMESIAKIAQKSKSIVIEDAAHAIGSSYIYAENKQAIVGSCTHSDAAVFSFHPVKTVTTGEGGAILTNDQTAEKRIRRLRSHGMVHAADISSEVASRQPWYYEMSEVGWNYRITDLQCALGTSQLKRLDQFKKRRKEIVEQYNKAFSNDPRFIIPPTGNACDPCFHLYTLQLSAGEETRLNLYKALRKENILTQIHYFPVHLQPYYKNKYGYSEGKCPIAERYYQRCISLPLYATLNEAEIQRVIHNVKTLAY